MSFTAIARKLTGGKKKQNASVALPNVQPQHLLAALERVAESSPEELTRTRRGSVSDDATASTCSTTSEAGMDPQAILKMLEQYGSKGGDDKYLQMIEAMQICQDDDEDDDCDFSLSDCQEVPDMITLR